MTPQAMRASRALLASSYRAARRGPEPMQHTDFAGRKIAQVPLERAEQEVWPPRNVESIEPAE